MAGLHVVITGASTGIGRSVAQFLGVEGARVVVSARTADRVDQVARSIEVAGGRAVGVTVDVASEPDVERLVKTAVDNFGPIDVLINNAGIARYAPVTEMSVDDWDDVMRTNLRGTFLCTHAAAPHMIERGRGKVVNVASTFGSKAVRGYGAYGASKAAVIYLTKVAALELAPYNIQVNAISPGYVATELNREALADQEVLRRIEGRTPARRVAEPEELFPLVKLLCGKGSDFITGQSFVIDGGFGTR